MPFRTLFLIVLLFGSSSLQHSCSGSDETPKASNTEEANTLLDIPYGDHPLQRYDAYLPANRSTTTTKTMILIHGGGWKSGDKTDMNGFVSLLQSNHPNLAILNINYVLATENIPAFPQQIEDIDNAIAHIMDNTNTYVISNQLGILGTSAGAHLGMLHAYRNNQERNIKMICNLVGPVDFTDPYYLEAQDIVTKTLLQDLSGQETLPHISYLETVSPVSYIDNTAPPTLSFYGNADPLIPNSQHNLLDTALNAVGVAHQLTVYEGGHANWATASFFDLNEQLQTAITRYLE